MYAETQVAIEEPLTTLPIAFRLIIADYRRRVNAELAATARRERAARAQQPGNPQRNGPAVAGGPALRDDAIASL